MTRLVCSECRGHKRVTLRNTQTGALKTIECLACRDGEPDVLIEIPAWEGGPSA